MSFGGGSSGGGGGQVQNQTVNPYAPAQPALNQIIGEAGNLYNQGVGAAGYVAPSTQTTQGLAHQEVMAKCSQHSTCRHFIWKIFKSFFISNVTRCC